MAVLIEGLSVVIRKDALHQKFPGGWNAFERIVPNKTLCTDNEIVRVGFMVPGDVENFVRKLMRMNLVFMQDGEAFDIVVVDQREGPTTKCTWLEFGHVDISGEGQNVSACRLIGSQITEVSTPLGWEFDCSLSSSSNFVLTENIGKELKYLRYENGLDVYLNPVTGEEVYTARSSKRKLQSWSQ